MQLDIRDSSLRTDVHATLALRPDLKVRDSSRSIVVMDRVEDTRSAVVIARTRAAAARAVWRFQRGELFGILAVADLALLPDLLRSSLDIGLVWSTPGVSLLAGALLTLTERQLTIAELLVAGSRVREIAQELAIADVTVKRECSELRTRLGIRTTVDLAFRLGELGHARNGQTR